MFIFIFSSHLGKNLTFSIVCKCLKKLDYVLFLEVGLFKKKELIISGSTCLFMSSSI